MNSTIHNMDCIAGMADKIADDSVHLTVTSIPFEELFTYSGKLEDVGNNGSTIDIREGRFALNMRFVIDQLYRVTAPGCNVCIHIQQLLAYKNQHGFSGRRDFRGAIIDLFRAGGFIFEGEAAEDAIIDEVSPDEISMMMAAHRGDNRSLTLALCRRLGVRLPTEFVIPKNPQAMAQRLNLHSLQFKTGYERGACKLAPAPNDYVLIFQKPGVCANDVRCLYHNEKNPGGWVKTDEWVDWATGVWGDIDEFDIIDGARSAKESSEEKHVCPLQLEVIRRLVRLYSNPSSIQPDVTVLDPFMGVGSTAAICVELDRNVIGFELKESYFQNALKNVEWWRAKIAAAAEEQMPLFVKGDAA